LEQVDRGLFKCSLLSRRTHGGDEETKPHAAQPVAWPRLCQFLPTTTAESHSFPSCIY